MPAVEYSVVIPVYRSAATLPQLESRLRAVFEAADLSYELVLVNDNSPDASWSVLRELHAQHPNVKVIDLARNFGQHPALLCGLAHAGGRFIVTMDDDLQHPPEEIPKLIEALRSNPDADAVIGSYEVKQHNWFRNLGTWVINWATSRVFCKDPGLKLTSFRIMRREVVLHLLRFSVDGPRVGQLLLMSTARIRNVAVRHAPRQVGRSGYTLARLIKDFLDNILGNSTLPLRFVVYLGFISSGSSFVLLLVYLIRYFAHGVSVPGWTTIILLLLFFFGLLFLTLGLIGEYLIRILRETRKAPLYAIREVLE